MDKKRTIIPFISKKYLSAWSDTDSKVNVEYKSSVGIFNNINLDDITNNFEIFFGLGEDYENAASALRETWEEKFEQPWANFVNKVETEVKERKNTLTTEDIKLFDFYYELFALSNDCYNLHKDKRNTQSIKEVRKRLRAMLTSDDWTIPHKNINTTDYETYICYAEDKLRFVTNDVITEISQHSFHGQYERKMKISPELIVLRVKPLSGTADSTIHIEKMNDLKVDLYNHDSFHIAYNYVVVPSIEQYYNFSDNQEPTDILDNDEEFAQMLRELGEIL